MKRRDPFEVIVPDGRVGEWAVETFTISRYEAALFNVNARRESFVFEGTYKRLIHDTRGVVMSDTRFEKTTNINAYVAARGRVLINGLGLGMLLGAVLSKPEVTHVRVVEKEADVIALVWPSFAKFEPRAEIVHADALDYRPGKDERYDFVWHDIWDFTGPDMIPTMTALKRKWGRRAAKQDAWTSDLVRKRLRQEREQRWYL